MSDYYLNNLEDSIYNVERRNEVEFSFLRVQKELLVYLKLLKENPSARSSDIGWLLALLREVKIIIKEIQS